MWLFRSRSFYFKKLGLISIVETIRKPTSVVSLHYWILNYFQTTDHYISYKSELNFNKPEQKYLQIENNLSSARDIKLLDYIITSEDIKHHRIAKYDAWDKELYRRLSKDPKLTNAFKVMDFWINHMPNKCSYLDSYIFAVEYMDNIVKNEEIRQQNLIQIMHYVSFLKNNFKSQNIMDVILNKLHKQDNLIKFFTLEEMCIFCNALFTTSTKIKSKIILKHIVDALLKHLDVILLAKNHHLIACLVKPLRLSKYYDYNALETIAQKVTVSKLKSCKTVAHLLAWYSDAFYSNTTHLEQLGCNFCENFKLESEIINIRIKDIDRFLWAYSNLGCEKWKNEIKDIVVPYLIRNIIYVQESPAYFMNTLLWLHMLQCSTDELSNHVLTFRNLQRILKTGNPKNIARFSLLLTCLNIENKHFVSSEMSRLQTNYLEPDMGMHLALRKYLNKVYKVVKCLQTNLGITNVKVSYQIPHLYIAGISIQTSRSKSEIEVLDSPVCLHKSSTPHGLMKLKLRLLEKLGRKVILVEKDISEMDTDTLFIYIDELIKSHHM